MTYQPTPFFVTSRGAGVRLNTFASMTADVGQSDPSAWKTTVDGDRRRCRTPKTAADFGIIRSKCT